MPLAVLIGLPYPSSSNTLAITNSTPGATYVTNEATARPWYELLVILFRPLPSKEKLCPLTILSQIEGWDKSCIPVSTIPTLMPLPIYLHDFVH